MERIKLNPLGGMGGGGGSAMPQMPQIGAPVHMASRVGGPEHSYLGHFGQSQFLKAGHNTVHTGSFHGKSNALGHGGRAAQLRAQGVPGAVIGAIARRKHAAPGQANYHGK